jgi:hypothetical protein
LFGSSMAILLAQTLPESQFLSWGWRLPFIASLVLLVIGLWIRLRVHEAEEFLSARTGGATVRHPVQDVLRRHGRAVLLGTAVTLVCHATYLVTTFLPGYARSVLDVSSGAALIALCAGSAASALVLALVGRRAQGRDLRVFAMAGGLMSAAWIFPAFWLTVLASSSGLVIGVVVGTSLTMLQYAVLPALLAAQFPVTLRYSGVSLCFQISAVVGGGVFPIVASWTSGLAGGAYWPAALLMVLGGLVTAFGARRIEHA